MSKYSHFMPLLALYASSSLAADPPKPAAPPAAPPTLVEAVNVKVDTVNIEATAVGTLRAEENVIVRSEIAGRIQALHFSEGQVIEAGKVLVSLDPAEYKATLAQSNATLNLNNINFERNKDLVTKNLTSRQAFDEARAKLEESRAHQALDQVHLEKTEIRAPFRGVLGLRNISQGAYIKPGDDLATLVDLSSVKLDFRISEAYLPQVKIGQTVNIHVDSYPKLSFSGKVYALDPSIDEETRTVLLRARIPNPKGELFAGMFARVALVLEQHPNALVIPEQAIVPVGNDSFVYKVLNGKAVQTKVKLGVRRTGDVEVVTGLQTEDVIITTGQMKLRPNADVSILDKKPATTSPKPADKKE
jgi:membrane fusion protein (multidrug efflux system)